MAVSLSVATEQASLPIAWRLYLPTTWAQDRKRREQTGVPEEISFKTKPVIALEQIRQGLADGVTAAPVLADAAYGDDTQFRKGITELSLAYVVGVRGHTSVWRPGEARLSAKPRKWKGRPPKLLRRDKKHQPVSVKKVALSLPAKDWRTISWRQGTKQKLRSRFAALRVRPAHRDYWRSELRAEEWLLIEWPTDEREPTKYWLGRGDVLVGVRNIHKPLSAWKDASKPPEP